MEERYDDMSATPLEPQPGSKEKEIIELVRMARRRHTVPCPDAEKEWQRIEGRLDESVSESSETVPQSTHTAVMRRLRLVAAAAMGAAAMLVAVLCYNHFFSRSAADGLVALDFDDNTPQITLTDDDDNSLNLSGRDSVSFVPKKGSRPVSDGRQQDLSTPRGMDFKVILSDGTEVWLNAESKIKFPAAFTGGGRRVELQGEAYFKVAHNAQRPFIVSTERMNIRVLGTEFNLRNYSQEAPRVSLIKGSVAVLDPESNTEECRLQPGQGAWRDSEGTFHVGQVDTYADTQWVDGFFYFDNVPLVNILRELGRWYNLGVVFHNPAAANQRLHFSASREDGIKESLSILNNMLKAHITVEGTDIVVR